LHVGGLAAGGLPPGEGTVVRCRERYPTLSCGKDGAPGNGWRRSPDRWAGQIRGSFDFALRAALRMTANLGPLISTFARESTGGCTVPAPCAGMLRNLTSISGRKRTTAATSTYSVGCRTAHPFRALSQNPLFKRPGREFHSNRRGFSLSWVL
jgi:hypothetical protein